MGKLLQSGCNLLLLDEPTNDLDVDTLRALEDVVPGILVATHILAFEGDSQVTFFEGNFADFEKVRHERLGIEADTPHRIKYKPLVRA